MWTISLLPLSNTVMVRDNRRLSDLEQVVVPGGEERLERGRLLRLRNTDHGGVLANRHVRVHVFLEQEHGSRWCPRDVMSECTYFWNRNTDHGGVLANCHVRVHVFLKHGTTFRTGILSKALPIMLYIFYMLTSSVIGRPSRRRILKINNKQYCNSARLSTKAMQR